MPDELTDVEANRAAVISVLGRSSRNSGGMQEVPFERWEKPLCYESAEALDRKVVKCSSYLEVFQTILGKLLWVALLKQGGWLR